MRIPLYFAAAAHVAADREVSLTRRAHTTWSRGKG
jgi:hypothetical protein